MKRIISLLLVLGLSISIVGCTSKEIKDVNNQQPEEEVKPVEEIKEEVMPKEEVKPEEPKKQETPTKKEDTSIKKEEVKKLTLKKTSLKLNVNDTYTLKGNYANIEWKSSDESIATVDEKGKIIAIKSGSCTITASVEGQSKICKVKVLQDVIDFNMKQIDQYAAGYPMGCEAAALLQALHNKGAAKNYSLKSFIDEMPRDPNDNPFKAYAGEPDKSYTKGVFQSILPAPLAAWGNNYGRPVSDISGKSADYLISEVKKGNIPVVFIIYKYKEPKYKSFVTKDGFEFTLVDNCHVVTVSGYNPNTKEVKITDPAGPHAGLGKSYWVSYSKFKTSYEYMKYGVIVK